MKLFLHPCFLICSITFLLNQLLEQLGYQIWVLNSFLDDLLCLPISLTLVLVAERLYFSNASIILPKGYVLVSILLFGLVFEVLLPQLSPKHTADIWDMLAYSLGGLIFEMGINRPISDKVSKSGKEFSS